MKRILALVSLSLAVLAPARAQQKKRVAVFNFDYGTVHSSVISLFGGNVDVGKGIADLIVDRLVKGGAYSVIERKALDKILTEQNFSNSDRADPSSAARLGRVLGVDAIVIGSITQFGRDDKSTGVGGGVLGGLGGRYGIGGIAKRQSKAVVQLSARIVSTETAEVLAVASGMGESKRSGTSLLGAGGGSGTAAGGGYDMSSSQFASTILGEAVNQAVTQMVQELEQNAGRVTAKKFEIDGLVADVSQNTLILNIGAKTGVKVGDKLQVRRPNREIRDPATGKVLRRIEDTLGVVTITEADEGSSVGTYSGSTPPKVGDRVTNPQQ
jgi:curli biogenesis system outer membrane secretion channel CsgG